MDKDTLAKVAAVLTTLREIVGPGEVVPASQIYMALGWDMMMYTSLVNIMSHNGWVKCTPSTVALTDAGVVLADKITQALERNRVNVGTK
jgi:hypothetical protein